MRLFAKIQPSIFPLILVLAGTHFFDAMTAVARQAYLRSSRPAFRPVYLNKIVPEFVFLPKKPRQLEEPLSGPVESSDLRYKIFDQHHREKLNVGVVRNDPTPFMEQNGKRLIGFIVYVLMNNSEQEKEFS